MIVAISDCHIGAKESNDKDVVDFLAHLFNRDDITDLVLCGDILDFWRRDVCDMPFVSTNAMFMLNAIADSGVNVHYVAGNHDYIMRNADVGNKHIKFSTSAEIVQDGLKWSFIHGWEFDKFMNPAYFDAACYATATHGDIVRRTHKAYLNALAPLEGAIASLRARFIKDEIGKMINRHDKQGLMKNRVSTTEDVLGSAEFPGGGMVFGHLHLPYLNTEDSMANCGSWHRGYPMHNTYIEIDGSTVHLRRWTDDKEGSIC